MNPEPSGRRSILITGASSGFGLMTARLALSQGWRVAATARRPEAIELDCSQDLLRLRLDVTNGETVREAVRVTLSAFGALDAVVNNAG
jgi:NADP-dependent 3-hydroxy acid dehydrogenase YdfG